MSMLQLVQQIYISDLHYDKNTLYVKLYLFFYEIC